MKRYLSVTIIFALCLLLTSCSPAPRTELFDSPFRCELGWSFDSCDFRASFVCYRDQSNDFSMVLTSPPELKGLSLERRAGKLSSYVGGAESDCIPDLYLYLSTLLISSSPFHFISRASTRGIDALCYSRDQVNWYFSAADGSPLGFDDGNTFFKIIWIEGA